MSLGIDTLITNILVKKALEDVKYSLTCLQIVEL